MLHSAFEIGGHHAMRHRGTLALSYVSRIMYVCVVVMRCNMDSSTWVVRVNHAATLAVVLRNLLFYCTFTVGGVVVTRMSSLHTAVVVVVCTVMVITSYT
jgi:hypothetical protein